MTRPNILLIMTDQQRADSLGCYGADWLETPNLDGLAAAGTRFSSCTVNNPICTPSR
ncbi:MAG: sulfatase-like hydrolase/transferase, partial [Hyphomicrobiaceae bacterium]|nr:sulfatase-like hydrolase/transferase [Hyphomicrobiaceae bacterium]